MEANYFTILYWFCHISVWIRHRCTRVPHPEPRSHLPPRTIPLKIRKIIVFSSNKKKELGGYGTLTSRMRERQRQFILFFVCVLFIYIFYFTILYWFCHTLTWIRHGCTWVPNPEPPSHHSPHIISLGYPSAPAPSILYPASNLGLCGRGRGWDDLGEWHWNMYTIMWETNRQFILDLAKLPFMWDATDSQAL